MSYLALYRKYRPKTFDEIVGQKAVVAALRNQVKYNQIGHAYLFTGTRGTGKTSMAKVFARAVNCLHPVDGNPCNECELCREGESNFNVIEIDAASNNGVDNIRDLREEVQYTPARGRYKVYIIDEVHMLSPAAFNALLKTLEEPPAHAIFVLATTDPQKVLPTIVSRCQRYDFRRITQDEIRQQLSKVCSLEGMEASEDALHFIAGVADGSMRDALSLLDQCRAYYTNEPITLDKVEEVLGAASGEVFMSMTDALIRRDVKALLDGVASVFDTGRDAVQFVISWNGFLRDVLVSRVLGTRARDLSLLSAASMQTVERLASMTTPAELSGWIEELSRLEATLKVETQRRILIEVALIRMATQNMGVQAPPSQVAPQRTQPPATQPTQTTRQPATQPVTQAGRAEAPSALAPSVLAPSAQRSVDISRLKNDWKSYREELISQNGSLACLRFVEIVPGGPNECLLWTDQPVFLRQLTMNDNEKVKLIEDFLRKKTGEPSLSVKMK